MATAQVRAIYGKKPKKFTLREPRLYLLTITPGSEELPILITGFRSELSGNLMLYNNRRLWVFHQWHSLRQANFDEPLSAEELLREEANLVESEEEGYRACGGPVPQNTLRR